MIVVPYVAPLLPVQPIVCVDFLHLERHTAASKIKNVVQIRTAHGLIQLLN